MALYFPIISSVKRSGPAFITPPKTTTLGMLSRPIPIRLAGRPLSQLAMKTPPSKGVALPWISISWLMISREAKE